MVKKIKMGQQRVSIANKQKNLIQYYVHKDIVNWLKKILDDDYADVVTIYDRLYHCDFIDVQYVEIFSEISKCISVSQVMRLQMKLAQYKMPWISDTTYFTTSKTNLLLIREKLSTIADKYLTETRHVKVTWFGENDLYIMQFLPECEIDGFKPEIEKEIKSHINEFRKPLFITNVFALHKASRPPSAMQTNILTAFHGKFLHYLSVNDVLALEIAMKDHRVSQYDVTLDMDIQQHLRKRLNMLYGNVYPDKFDLGLINQSSTLCHFVCKYHDRFTTIKTPLYLINNEAQLLSEMYKIKINYSSHACTQLVNKNGAPGLSVSITLENRQWKESRADRFNWLHDGTWENFMADYNPNENLHVTIGAEMDCSSELFISLFLKIINMFQSHNPYKAFLYFIAIDFNLVPPSRLVNIFKIFYNIEFDRMILNINQVFEILDKCSPQSQVILRACDIEPKQLLNVLTIPIPIRVVKLMECNLDMNSQFTIFEWLARGSEIHIVKCHYLSNKFAKALTNVSVSVVKFSKMEYNIELLFKILKRFRTNTNLIFAKCVLTGSSEKRFDFFLNPATITFLASIFEGTTFLEILYKCAKHTEICFDNCNFLQPIDNSPIVKRTEVTTAVFIGMSFKINHLLIILRRFKKHCTVFLLECEIIPTVAPNFDMNIQISTILFGKMKYEVAGLFAILNQLPQQSRINFENCHLYSRKSVRAGSKREPLNLHFQNTQFETGSLYKALEHLHRDSRVLFEACHVHKMDEIFDGRKIGNLSFIKFKDMNFEFIDFIRILEKFNKTTTVRFNNCAIGRSDKIFSNICVEVSETLFENMTFHMSTLLKFLERFSETSQVSLTDCNIVDLESPSTFACTELLKVSRIDFNNIAFTPTIFLSILAQFREKSLLNIYDCHIVSESCVITKNLLDLTVKFTRVSFEIQAVLEIIQKFTQNSVILFSDCEFEEGTDWIPTNAKIHVNCLIFSDNRVFSPRLVNLLQCIQSNDCLVQFYNCQLNNQNLVDICTKTTLFQYRLAILGEHQIDESFFFDLFLQYYHRNLEIFNGLGRENHELEIPVHIIPIVSKIKNNFDWSNMRIVCKPVNDMTIKLEVTKNGVLFDLFYELNSLTEEHNKCEIDYY